MLLSQVDNVQLIVEHPDGVRVLVRRPGGQVTPLPLGSLHGMLTQRPLQAVEVLGAFERWTKGRSTLSGVGDLGGVGRWDWDKQAAAQPRAEQAPQAKPRAEQPPPPLRPNPNPRPCPPPPMPGSPATSRTPPSPALEEEDQPPDHPPPPPTPNPVRGWFWRCGMMGWVRGSGTWRSRSG